MKSCFCQSNIKFISFRHRVISSVYILFQWQCPPMPANDIAMLVFTVVFFGMFFVQLTGMAILVSYYEQQPACHTTASLGIAGIGTGLPFFLAFSIGLTMNIYFSRYWAHWRRTNKHVIVYLDSIEEVVVA